MGASVIPSDLVAARVYCRGLAALFAAGTIVAAGAAHAIIQGSSSSLDRHTVRVSGICSGVAIDRTTVVTAGHCVGRRASVSAGGRYVGVASISRGGATLENGTRVRVSGDAAILKLRSALPGAIVPLPVGDGDGPYVIAGYGTPSEHRRSFGALREATLVDSGVERHMLVDPNRSGAISASACFGDSGGPVLRRSGMGYVVVGVITRANYPRKRIACGFYTRYAPVTASAGTTAAQAEPAEPAAPAAAEVAAKPETPAKPPRRSARRRAPQPEAGGRLSRLVSFFARNARAD